MPKATPAVQIVRRNSAGAIVETTIARFIPAAVLVIEGQHGANGSTRARLWRLDHPDAQRAYERRYMRKKRAREAYDTHANDA